MLKLKETFGKVMRFRAVSWAGYSAWGVILLLLLSFAWGNMVENQPRAALVGGMIFVITLMLGIGIRMLVRSVVKEKRDQKDVG